MIFGINQSKKQKVKDVYVLACPRNDGTLAVLCRTVGDFVGPAACQSKKGAIQLKTKLANDPRGIGNHRALEMIQSLFVYKLPETIEPVWEPGALWAYVPESRATCVEKQNNLFN